MPSSSKKTPPGPRPGDAGGAAGVSPVKQDRQPLLGGGAMRSDDEAGGSSGSSPTRLATKGMGKTSTPQLTPTKSRTKTGAKKSGGGCCGKACDKLWLVRLISWLLDVLEGDNGLDDEDDGKTKRMCPKGCATLVCLLGCIGSIVALFVFAGPVVGSFAASAFEALGSPDLQSVLGEKVGGAIVAAPAAIAGAVGGAISFVVGLPSAVTTFVTSVPSLLVASMQDAVLWLHTSGEGVEVCEHGLLIPSVMPTPLSTSMTLGMLLWMFMGVAIGADLFMEAIETITSREETVYVQMPGGRKRAITSHVWNATVANLTLMALGSSAPEILLSVIEIGGNGFYSGELGPSTIVGSAAFNLMVISAVCVIAIPDGEGRYVKQQNVFFVTAFFSVFAYLWLTVILVRISPNVIDVWEGLVTLAMFPGLVYIAYLTDTGKLFGDAPMPQLEVVSSSAGEAEKALGVISDAPDAASAPAGTITHSRGLRTIQVFSANTDYSGLGSAIQKTAAYYRMNAMRRAVGGITTEVYLERKAIREEAAKERRAGKAAGNASRKVKLVDEEAGSAPADKKSSNGRSSSPSKDSPSFAQATGASKARTTATVESAASTIDFGSLYFTANEETGYVDVKVFRTGSLASISTVSYSILAQHVGTGGNWLEQGKATEVLDAAGRITFAPTQQTVTLRIGLIDDDGKTPSKKSAFKVKLSDPSSGVSLGKVQTCNVRVVAGRAPGTLCIGDEGDGHTIHVKESAGIARILVNREEGTAGEVSCVVNTKDGSAVAPADYGPLEGHVLTFAEGESQKVLEISIVDDHHFEGDETFSVVFSDATGGASFSANCDGGPERAVVTVVIECDDEADEAGCAGALVRVGVNADLWHLVMSDWWHQFGDVFDFDSSSCSFAQLIAFLLTVPWKLVFALAPPPRLARGWATFVIVLVIIGAITALIGDFAAALGCCLGISKSITAITFVALGTSLPDTFASMSAAQNEPHADNSLGNITGSNSVNVFLGLGLPWAVAAIYWRLKGTDPDVEAAWRHRYHGAHWYDHSNPPPVAFAVPAGALGFSVAVFTVCAVAALALLFLRRAVLGFELGGPVFWARATAVTFVGLWLVYIVLSIWREMPGSFFADL